MLISIVVTSLHHLSFLSVDPLPQVFKSVGHVLLCCLTLLHHFTLLRLEPLIMVIEFIDLALNLHLQFLYGFDNNRVSFLQQLDIVTSMLAVDHALWTHGWHIAIKAKVRNLLLWVLSA